MSEEKDKLLRSTEKSGEKQNVSDPFDYDFICNVKARILIVVLIHVMFIVSLIHLGLVSFFLKTQGNPVPGEVLITAILFGTSYLSILIMWIITIQFCRELNVGVGIHVKINDTLFRSINYASPLRASSDTTPLSSGNIGIKSVAKAILDNYYNPVMVVLAILFSWFISMLLVWPSKILELIPHLHNHLLFFGILLVAFWGAGSTLVALLLRFVCFFEVNIKRNFIKFKNR